MPNSLESDLYYLRSILGHLRDVRSVMTIDGPTLGGEVLADNINWLDCYIDRLEKQNARQTKAD